MGKQKWNACQDITYPFYDLYWQGKIILVELQRKGGDLDQDQGSVVEGQGQETGTGDPGNTCFRENNEIQNPIVIYRKNKLMHMLYRKKLKEIVFSCTDPGIEKGTDKERKKEKGGKRVYQQWETSAYLVSLICPQFLTRKCYCFLHDWSKL